MKRRISWAVCCIGLAGLLGAGALARPSIGQTAAPEAAQLRAEAERSGAVRVVVTLAVAGAQPPSAEAIGAAQERLLASLAGTGYSDLRRLRNVPQLALTARRDALEALLASPLVAAVAPDALAATQSPGLAR